MGLFNKPLLPAHYENEDVQISAELCSNIAINVVGLAKSVQSTLGFTCYICATEDRVVLPKHRLGEITVLSGSEDMIHIKTSVQAKGSILKNAAALEPVQDGNRYTYTIHTPLEEKLERSVTFQVFVTIPRHLDSLESFTVQGTNIELSIGNISHTFIKSLAIQNVRGDITIDSFYGESAIIKNTMVGGISGKYSVARLLANAKSGKIQSKVHLLNTDESQPAPKVICATLHHPVTVSVDGTDLFGPLTVEAKTQCQPLDVKVLLASTEQKLLGNFINFGGPTKIRLSGNYQGRIETRTHYGKITIDEPEFERIEGATLSLPSLSDRNASGSVGSLHHSNRSHSGGNHHHTVQSTLSSGSSSSNSSIHQSTAMSSRTSSQGSSSWDKDDPRHHQSYLNYPYTGNNTNGSQQQQHHPMNISSAPGSTMPSGANSRANSIHGSITETRSVFTTKSEKERKKKDEDKESTVTKEVIGTIGQGTGLIMAKNSSGDITISLI
ncbi:hypothetical protein EDD11_010398 [Mortierella claussenii]|nr:hypothetical protein EDD11_010398 [Mortierella claussenii]